MARTIDLTEKLGLDEKPTITIGDTTLTVDNSATSILRIMQVIGDGTNVGAEALLEAADLLFEPKSRKALDKLSLSFEDFSTVISSAMDLITGGDDDEGEGETLATK